MEPITETNDNSFEIIDFNQNSNDNSDSDEDTGSENPFTATEKEEHKAINMEEKDDINTEFNISSNNKFFTPTLNERPSIEMVNEKKVENPMDRVKELKEQSMDDYVAPGELSLKDSINIVRRSLEELGNKGVYAEVEEIDFENYYQITVKIPKDN